MFDRLDILTRDDSRSPTPIPTRSRSDREREQPSMGHRREHEPRQDKRGFQERVEGALADVGMYRNVSYRDLVESQFGGHPYTARRAVDRMIRDGHVREHQAKGPRGGTYKVLTLTEAGARKARDYAVEQGFDKEQQTWSGLVKRGELSHDTAVYRAARIEQRRPSATRGEDPASPDRRGNEKTGGTGHRKGAGHRRQGGGRRGAAQGRSGFRSSHPTGPGRLSRRAD